MCQSISCHTVEDTLLIFQLLREGGKLCCHGNSGVECRSLNCIKMKLSCFEKGGFKPKWCKESKRGCE